MKSQRVRQVLQVHFSTESEYEAFHIFAIPDVISSGEHILWNVSVEVPSKYFWFGSCFHHAPFYYYLLLYGMPCISVHAEVN